MFLSIDFQSERPIYEQIYRQIIEGIAKNHLEPGDSLPSVRQLGEQLGVNMHTIHKSYQWLREDGYVVMDRRKGATIANPLPPKTKIWEERRREELTFLLAEGLVRGMKIDEFEKELHDLLKSLEKGGRL
ncbi:MAG: GntR family transcriptional regulator [Tissierellia bacterium]|nr:GntR family transcriptional regulator [Tissierellia bacterium]